MAKKTKTRTPRLGRGLNMLMAPQGEEASDASGSASSSGVACDTSDGGDAGHIMTLPVGYIRPNRQQPRATIDQKALQQLAESIRSNGVIQPIIVRPTDSDNTYELVAGERRWRAAQLAGLSVIPAVVHAIGDDQVALWALVENLQREDLNPLERANGFVHLIEAHELSHEQVAQRVGIDRTTVTNALRLLHLHPDVQKLIAHGLLSAGMAKALAGVNDLDRQLDLAEKSIRKEWSVRRLEAVVRTTGGNGHSPSPSKRAAHLADLERQIGLQLQTKVKVRAGRKKGSGTLCIDFFDLDQFESLLTKLGVQTE